MKQIVLSELNNDLRREKVSLAGAALCWFSPRLRRVAGALCPSFFRRLLAHARRE